MFVKKLLSLGAALAVVAACADTPTQPELLDASLIGAADRNGMVPFKGALSLTSQLVASPGPSFDPGCENTAASGALVGEIWVPAGTVLGIAKATHLGQSTVVQNSCLEISFLFGDLGPILALGEATITAANGDEIFYTFEGVVERVNFIADVDAIITGGSGRFVGASGGFNAISEGPSTVFPAVFPFNGKISSVGSLR